MNQAMMMRIKKMQKELEQKQQELQEKEFTASCGGVVTVVVKGSKEVVSIKIDKEALSDLEDLEFIEDSIQMALNEAFKQIEKEGQELLGPLGQQMGGLF